MSDNGMTDGGDSREGRGMDDMDDDAAGADRAERRVSFRRVVLCVVLAFIVAAGVASALIGTGVIPIGSRDTAVPCNDLTSYRDTQSAYDERRAVVDRIDAVGTGVTVAVRHADCPTQSEQKGYIAITYAHQDERDRIMRILDNKGLGTYAVLEHR